MENVLQGYGRVAGRNNDDEGSKKKKRKKSGDYKTDQAREFAKYIRNYLHMKKTLLPSQVCPALGKLSFLTLLGRLILKIQTSLPKYAQRFRRPL
jgi:hypothetical protein